MGHRHKIACFLQISNPKGVAMRYQLRKTITFVGMMGAGKTSIGKLVAQKFGVKFVDSDHEIEKAANMSVTEIFARDGEQFFRAKESQILERLLQREPCILSTGGGAYISEVNRAMISEYGVAVWLKADIDLLWSRIHQKKTRPLLSVENPYQTLSDLYKKRSPIYAKAEIIVESEQNLGVEEMVKKVIEILVKTPGSSVKIKAG